MSQTVTTSPIPAHLGTRAERRFNVKFIAGGLLLLAFVAFLSWQIVQATRTTGAYFMTVAELMANKDKLVGQRIRVNGNVVGGSENWNAEQIILKFAIEDAPAVGTNGKVINVSNQTAGTVLPIIFYGPRPDNFHRAASAIVQGQLLADGTFQAEELLLKCPSRYEEEPAEVHAKATH